MADQTQFVQLRQGIGLIIYNTQPVLKTTIRLYIGA